MNNTIASKINKLKASTMSKEQEETELKEIEKSFREKTISKFKKLLTFSVEAEVTDVILAAGHHYYWRHGKTLQKGSTAIWTANEVEIIASYLLTGDTMSQIRYDEVFLSAETSYQLVLPSLSSPRYYAQVDNDEVEVNEVNEVSEVNEVNEVNEVSESDKLDKSDKLERTHQLSEIDNLVEQQEQQYFYEEKMPQRFRVSIFKEKGRFRIVLRLIPTEMRSLKELNLPPQLENIANLPRGLVLVTGATGQGKSTTISAILEHINRTRLAHIITLEDPIEFVYKSKQSLVTQREVSSDNRYFYDVKDYPTGIRDALRQSPDVIMVGEIRDATTFEAVLTAAESGHLVISAIHTADVMATLEKIVSYYPERQESTILTRLSRSLAAIVSQRLLPSNPLKLEVERIPSVEIMRVVAGTAECFRTHEKINEIPEKMKNGRELYGMQTFDQHIIDLLKQGFITIDTAITYATSPGEVEASLTKLGVFI